jgi:nitric oxide reductase NorQ protein
LSSPDKNTAKTTITTSAEGKGARLSVKLSVTPRTGEQSLKEKYGVGKYDLGVGYPVPEALKNMIPSKVPDYVDEGEGYVERIMRALYYFKQTALIGPSGTGKSVCRGEPVFVYLDGKPRLTTVDSLFEELGRKYPVRLDEDNWETIVLSAVDLQVLSIDRVSGGILWKRAHAIARSVFKGTVVEITTSRNRTIKATPEHSFITDEEEVKAGQVRPGTRIPVMRRIPKIGQSPLQEIAVADLVPGAKLTERGVVLGAREDIQIPAPPMIALNEEFSWFLGFFVAEGYVGKGFGSICQKEVPAIERCARLLDSMGLATTTRVQGGLTELRVFSKAFVSMLSLATVSGRVGSGKGSQARYKKVPDFVFAMSDTAKVAFLRGFLEGDGWEEEGGSELLLGTSSRELANGLVMLCEQLDIFPTVRVKRTKGATSYSLSIARDGAAKLGVTITGLKSATDNRGHVEKVKVTPEMLEVAKRAYKQLRDELKTKGLHKRTVSHFYSSTRMIGLRTLSRIATELSSPELKRMAETSVLWDAVKRVERSQYDGWVYDFQVPGTETFAAGFGGVLTHNTHIVYLVAQIAGMPLWEINCGLQTSVYDLFGRFVGLGKENWIDGTIVSWCRYGGILYLDEANMMKQDIATRLNPILDTRGHMVLNEKDNEVIPRHPFGYVVISMNPYSSEFSGTKPLNAAFRRRMSVWIDFDYLSVGTRISQREVKMLSERSKIPMDVAEKVIRVGAEVRKRYKTGDLPYGPSVGDLLNWGTLIADGLDPKAAADETLISLISDDAEIQAVARRIVALIFGSGEAKPAEKTPTGPVETPERP